MISPGFWLLVAGLVGACIGSFLNVVIWRLPRGEGVAKGRSHCPRCGHAIRWHDNVPVLSWLLLRGRCRDCRGPIAARYPLVEALTAALFVLLALRRDLPADAARYAVTALLLAALLAVAFIDAEHRIIPDAITKPGIVLGLLSAFLLAGLRPTTFLPEFSNRHLAALFESGLGAATGACSLLAVRWLAFLAFRKEGMGLGDVKLLAMVGAYSSWLDVLLILFVASVGGSVLGGFYVLARARRLAPLEGHLRAEGGAEVPFHRARIRAPRRVPLTLAAAAPGFQGAPGAPVAVDLTLPAGTIWAEDGRDVRLSLRGLVEEVTPSAGGPLVRIRPSPLAEADEEHLATFALHRLSIPFGVFLSAASAAVILYGDAVAHFVLVTWPHLVTGR